MEIVVNVNLLLLGLNVTHDNWVNAMRSNDPNKARQRAAHRSKGVASAGLPKAYHSTVHGSAYVGDSIELLGRVDTGSVSLAITSPPYALHFKKEYGNASKHDYVAWFLPFAREIHRVLSEDGSFVLNIGGSYNPGVPTRSLYHFKLLVSLVEDVGFHLAQECFWYNPAKMPVPAEWVTVRRVRIRDSVEYVWWLSKTPWPKADNRAVLRPFSNDMIRLNRRGVKPATRPSGHVIRSTFDDISTGGAIPPNVTEAVLPESMMKFGNNASNDSYIRGCRRFGLKPHPARFPLALPAFYIRMLTHEGDTVLDPFAGSNTTGWAAESLKRRWLAFEMHEEYLRTGKLRFETESAQEEPPRPQMRLKW